MNNDFIYGQFYRIRTDDPRYVETLDEAMDEAGALVDAGEYDSLDIEHMEDGLHGYGWYRVETVTN